ncbi:hypothetical protein [Sphingomonas sp.]|uniref:hypothetical protein n=1 Tax=Sphingomonas sp. TaxID=28214 RepID=UPI0035BC81C5
MAVDPVGEVGGDVARDPAAEAGDADLARSHGLAAEYFPDHVEVSIVVAKGPMSSKRSTTGNTLSVGSDPCAGFRP